MSIYDQRDHSVIPAESPSVPDEWAENRHILAWWTEQHDHILKALITEWHWSWYGKATDAILAITPSETIDAWRKQDRLCRRYAWYNVLMGFCQARARKFSVSHRRYVKPKRVRVCCAVSPLLKTHYPDHSSSGSGSTGSCFAPLVCETRSFSTVDQTPLGRTYWNTRLAWHCLRAGSHRMGSELTLKISSDWMMNRARRFSRCCAENHRRSASPSYSANGSMYLSPQACLMTALDGPVEARSVGLATDTFAFRSEKKRSMTYCTSLAFRTRRNPATRNQICERTSRSAAFSLSTSDLQVTLTMMRSRN